MISRIPSVSFVINYNIVLCFSMISLHQRIILENSNITIHGRKTTWEKTTKNKNVILIDGVAVFSSLF